MATITIKSEQAYYPQKTNGLDYLPQSSSQELLGTISVMNPHRRGDIITNHRVAQELLKFYPAARQKAPKPISMSNAQYFNYLAIQLLEETGNECPTQEAIDYTEALLKRMSRKIIPGLVG